MATRVALGLLVSAVIALAAAYGVTLFSAPVPVAVAPAMAYGIGASMIGCFTLGAARRGTLAPWLTMVFALLFVVVTGTFWWVLALPPDEGAGGAMLLGVPRRTALILLGVGAVPAVLLPVAYAAAFDRCVLREEDLQELREGMPAALRTHTEHATDATARLHREVKH